MEKIITTPEIMLIDELKHRLEMKNIHSEMLEDTSTFISASGNITQYSLLVNESDIEQSLIIKDELIKEREKEENMPWCESCGYEDTIKETVEHKFSSIWFLIASPVMIVLGLVLHVGPFFTWVFIIGGILFGIQFFKGHTEEIYTCKKCGHKFQRHL